MWFEFKVAWRFLKSNKTQTVLILLGIIIGVSVQVFLGSLISGLQQDLINQTVGGSPHITILPEDQRPRPLVVNEDKFSRIVTFAGAQTGINRWREIEDYLSSVKEITAVSPTIDGSCFASDGQKNLPRFRFRNPPGHRVHHDRSGSPRRLRRRVCSDGGGHPEDGRADP